MQAKILKGKKNVFWGFVCVELKVGMQKQNVRCFVVNLLKMGALLFYVGVILVVSVNA